MPTQKGISEMERCAQHKKTKCPTICPVCLINERDVLQAEVERLKKKIKIVCVGDFEPPKFDPKALGKFPLDITNPENAYYYGWELAICKCGEVLSKP